MLKSSQFTRSAVIAAAAICLGASPAVARLADMPPRPKPDVTTSTGGTRQWTPPRVESMGVRPVDQPVAASPAPPVPLTRGTDASGGRDWLLIAIGSSVVALLLALAVVRANGHWAHPFRARRL
jgi:hypothetical protein